MYLPFLQFRCDAIFVVRKALFHDSLVELVFQQYESSQHLEQSKYKNKKKTKSNIL